MERAWELSWEVGKLALVCKGLGDSLGLRRRLTHLTLGRGERIRTLAFSRLASKPGLPPTRSGPRLIHQTPGWLSANLPNLRHLRGRYLDMEQLRAFEGLAEAWVDLSSDGFPAFLFKSPSSPPSSRSKPDGAV